MFRTTNNKGFSMTFENGNTVSVQWGPGNYCDHYALWRPFTAPSTKDSWESQTAEAAAWDADGKWHNFGSDEVKGYLSPTEVAEFIGFVATNQLDVSP